MRTVHEKGAPFGENREACENHARTRHCERIGRANTTRIGEGALRALESGDLPFLLRADEVRRKETSSFHVAERK